MGDLWDTNRYFLYVWIKQDMQKNCLKLKTRFVNICKNNDGPCNIHHQFWDAKLYTLWYAEIYQIKRLASRNHYSPGIGEAFKMIRWHFFLRYIEATLRFPWYPPTEILQHIGCRCSGAKQDHVIGTQYADCHYINYAHPLYKGSQITRFMGPTWGPSGTMFICWPREPSHQGYSRERWEGRQPIVFVYISETIVFGQEKNL